MINQIEPLRYYYREFSKLSTWLHTIRRLFLGKIDKWFLLPSFELLAKHQERCLRYWSSSLILGKPERHVKPTCPGGLAIGFVHWA